MIRRCRHKGPTLAIITARLVRPAHEADRGFRPDIVLKLCGACYLRLVGGELGELFSASELDLREHDPEEQI